MNSRIKILWFRHNHENRNDLLRMGLMRLHHAGAISYTERTLEDAVRFGFDKVILQYPDHRHLSFLLLEQNKTQVRVMVDSEDSFALISPLLKVVDICFCAGYNSDFFERRQFVNTYRWQSDADLAWYRHTLDRKITALGDHFHKVRRFVPIGPNLSTASNHSGWRQKIKNIDHKFRRATGRGTDFSDTYRMFEVRYNYLISLRNQPLKYDITLNDSLWGWPLHRIKLHKNLKALHAQGFDIRSILKWNEPVPHDGSNQLSIPPDGFPVCTATLDRPYEEMLAQSKLAVFACGFHWGWRNIMMLALMTGIPVYTDRLLTEPWFDVRSFRIHELEDVADADLAGALGKANVYAWNDTKVHNQQVYDQFMSPEAVGEYFLQTITSL